jgi:hypothetical protein
MISKAVYEDCNWRNKNLSKAWIDYQKAFDSIPYSWVERSTDLAEVNSKTVRFCILSLDKWNTILHLKTKQEEIQSQPIQIQRGILEGDSLLPLVFCIALIPLIDEMNRSDCGYQAYVNVKKISHYMDDLKLLERSKDNLENEIKIVKATSRDINMNYGL